MATVPRPVRADGQAGPSAMTSAGRAARTITRRTFLLRAGALGISATALGAVLEACERAARPSGSPGTAGSSPGSSPGGSGARALPVIDPTPVQASYGDLLETTGLAVVAVASPALRALLAEVAADARMPVAAAVVDGRRQARLTVTADDTSLPGQAYRLEVAAGDDGPVVTVRAGDEAGAFNGLLSLGRLAVSDGTTRWLRAATIDDAPGIARRGAILDPYVLPDTGVTDASRALLLERVRVGVRAKLNLVDLPDRDPWPELVRYCADHHVELMIAKGYRDWLSVGPRDEIKAQLTSIIHGGARSLAFCWDDIEVTDTERLAAEHASTFRDLYEHVRGLVPEVRVSAVLPPYGGIPGRNLFASSDDDGERYLALMRDALPDDVRVFWTGDGGVFSETVTAAGARAYADAIGHELGLWDNDTIRFSREQRPCDGRAADLASVIHAYMGNLAGEASWTGTSGELALLTSVCYAWNPAGYDRDVATEAAQRLLEGGATAG